MHPKSRFALAIALACAGSVPAGADASATSPYAGAQTREVASLSEADLAELRMGGGWGLALPAELNGFPGPAHVLDLRQELGLTPEQVGRMTAVRDRMRAQAIAAGERFIAAERRLGEAFASSLPSADQLAALVAGASEARAALRLVHLAAHLEAAPILTARQRGAYARLRGHGGPPCGGGRHGHDPSRRHDPPQRDGCGP